MKIPGIKGWFKQHKNEISCKNVICKNCETHFDGKFCPECGQSVKEYDKPFGFILYNFLGDFFSFDVRFFKTFGKLIFNPGFLTKEYFEGRRVRYAPPFRIFIFISFVMFLLLQIHTSRKFRMVLENPVSENLAENGIHIDSTSLTEIYSLAEEYSDSTVDLSENMSLIQNLGNLQAVLDLVSKKLEKDLKQETNPKEKEKLREYIRLCKSPEQAIVKIFEYMSWAFFLLLPVFALILKLVYIRRKHNYMRHLIFSIHIHSFIFFVYTIIVVLQMIFNKSPSLIITVLFVLIPVYFLIALKKFYGQSIGKVFLKFISVLFMYNFILVVTVGIVFLKALNFI